MTHSMSHAYDSMEAPTPAIIWGIADSVPAFVGKRIGSSGKAQRCCKH
jgi:hypothetical protein